MHSSVQFTLFSTVKYSFLVIKYQYSYISINNPIQTDYTDSNTYHSKQNKSKQNECTVQFTSLYLVQLSTVFLVIKYQYSYISINNPIQTDYTVQTHIQL